jgi:excinuclease ABC subunit C
MVIAVAKDPDRAFVPGVEEPVGLDDRGPSSLLLRRIRDEAHRFAVTFHRKLRGKRTLESPLLRVPGIRKKRHLALLKRFGSIESIRQATVDEIAAVPGMNRPAAEAVKRFLAGV